MGRETKIRLFGAFVGMVIGGFFGWIISYLDFVVLYIIMAETMAGGILIGYLTAEAYISDLVSHEQTIFVGPILGAVTGLLFGIVNPLLLEWPLVDNVSGGASAGMFIGAISGALIWVFSDDTF